MALWRNSINALLAIAVLFSLLTSEVLGQKNQRGAMANLIQLSAGFEALSAKVTPATVQVLVMGYTPTGKSDSNVFSRQRITGSGVILDSNGYIVTNAHVVEGARRVQVVLSAQQQPENQARSILRARGQLVGAQIVGVDRETDLAVLKIQAKNLPFLTLGNSDDVRQGQLVFAFGSPRGLENSVTMGVVSSTARQLRTSDPMIYIQTDATINPGNSGGPLVSPTGEVIGINTLIFSQSGGSEGIGFAAPSNIVKNVYEQIRETGRVRRGTIGVHAQTITPLLAAGLDLPDAGNVVVADVFPNSPADKAGLQVGDIILRLGDKRIENARQFDVNLYKYAIGNAVIIEIQRETVTQMIEVSIVERPNDPERFSDLVSPERNMIPRFGILGLDLNESIIRMIPTLRVKSGVVVANRSNLYYEQDQFMPGDVIHAINSQQVTSLTDLKAIVSKLQPYDPVVAQVERLGAMRYVVFEVE